MNVEDIKKRANSDTLEIEGRTFKILKFDPLLGNFILMKLSTSLLPFGLGEVISAATGFNFGNSKAAELNKKDFLELQRDILSVCFEVLPAGNAPVVASVGYGINDFNMNISIQLLIAAIAFNFTDFFVESLSALDKIKEV